MEQHESGWLYDGQACDRLWNKSAIGRPIEGGKLLLTSADVIFCHDYRHLEWPSANWLSESVGDSPRLLDEAVVVERSECLEISWSCIRTSMPLN